MLGKSLYSMFFIVCGLNRSNSDELSHFESSEMFCRKSSVDVLAGGNITIRTSGHYKGLPTTVETDCQCKVHAKHTSVLQSWIEIWDEFTFEKDDFFQDFGGDYGEDSYCAPYLHNHRQQTHIKTCSKTKLGTASVPPHTTYITLDANQEETYAIFNPDSRGMRARGWVSVECGLQTSHSTESDVCECHPHHQQTIIVTSRSTYQPSGWLVGTVVGSLLAILLIVLGLTIACRKRIRIVEKS